MHHINSYLNRVTNRLSKVLFALGGGLLLVVLGLTLCTIFLRAAGSSMRGVVEISGFLSAAAIGLCLPRAQRTGSHIEAGMMNERLPRPVRQCLQLGVSFLTLAFMAIVTFEVIGLGLFVHEVQELIDGWNFSYAVLVFALAAGCAVQGLVMIDDLMQAFMEYQRRKSALCPQSARSLEQ